MNILEIFDRDSETFFSEDLMIQFVKLYSTHVDEIILISQLSVSREYLKQTKSKSIIDMVQSLEKMPIAFSQIIQIMYIVLTLPVTTASNERFFSTLKRVKSYLRTTIGDDRLSHLMLMAVEPEMVKKPTWKISLMSLPSSVNVVIHWNKSNTCIYLPLKN